MGKENVFSQLEKIKFIKTLVEKKQKGDELREEINNLPYLRGFSQNEINLVKNLNQEEKIIFYRIKQVTDLNEEEVKAIFDLMKTFKFRYDYFLAAYNDHSYQTFISDEYIYSVVYSKHKEAIDTQLGDKSYEYKKAYLRGLYFYDLNKIYMNDLNRLFTEYNMGNYEANEYYIRNGSYSTYFSRDCIENIKLYEGVYSYYLESII